MRYFVPRNRHLKIFYEIFIFLYPKAAWLLGFYNEKARQWVNGRKDVFLNLAKAFEHNDAPVIWMHCASLGEFEQGRPILEALKETYPNHKILLSFFSPSGYEVRKNYAGADYITYLPIDSAQNAKDFFKIVQPSLILFVKYEFWYHYAAQAAKKNIPLVLVSGIFREGQSFFKWYGNFYRSILKNFSYFFVQDNVSAHLLNDIGFTDIVAISGDTRFDRVITIASQFEPIPIIEKFCANHTTIVAGSTWTEDDEELDHFINSNPSIKCIVAPHNINEDRLKECLHLYHRSMLFSDYEDALNNQLPIPENLQVLIVNNIGMLTQLYHYATVCMVGGGFGGDGVHNVLEAAVYGKPVVIGPVFEKYIEAVELVENGGCISVEDALEMEQVFNRLLDTNDSLYLNAATAAKSFVYNHAGATKIVMHHIQEKRLLIN